MGIGAVFASIGVACITWKDAIGSVSIDSVCWVLLTIDEMKKTHDTNKPDSRCLLNITQDYTTSYNIVSVLLIPNPSTNHHCPRKPRREPNKPNNNLCPQPPNLPPNRPLY
jgi:hypothetical protein